MGQEINRVHFEVEDFTRFSQALREETRLLAETMRDGRFSEELPCVAGVEIEGWLLDHYGFPLAENEKFLAALADPLVVPELSRFNFEMNCHPRPLQHGVLQLLAEDLDRIWQRCLRVAHACGHTLVLIGTLPTLQERDLTLSNLSPLNRYYALNDQVMRARDRQPVTLDIRGRDHLQLEHGDVMLEAATTSFQLHVQMPFSKAVRFYNAAQLLSGPMVAVSANSPFLFNHDLWAETRVPLFEQAVDTAQGHAECARVTFGNAWMGASPVEPFEENLARFVPLLPFCSDADPAQFSHVRLHNGTIWRWNRLLLGENGNGCPHVRLEHRVMPAGPTFIDMMANAALFYGAVYALAYDDVAPESCLPFQAVSDNFYAAARDGLAAELRWMGGASVPVRDLLLQQLIPLARAGLKQQDIECTEGERLLDIIRCRVESAQNGAVWQHRYIEAYPGDFAGLTARYLEHQRQGNPVHEWD